MTASALPPERRRPRAAAPLETILDAIGGTPCVRLGRVAPAGGAVVFAKVESFNPGGSVKDRIAASMIEAAERDGRLAPGGLVVEATSGNTGIGLALVCAVKGYRLTLVMPDSTSIEHRQGAASGGSRLCGAFLRSAVGHRRHRSSARPPGAVFLQVSGGPEPEREERAAGARALKRSMRAHALAGSTPLVRRWR